MIKAGLEDIVAATSAICDVNGKEGRLIYQGYDIHDLAENSTLEEVIYLLWFGHLPSRSELDKFSKELAANRALPKEIVNFMKMFPKAAQPMEVLRVPFHFFPFTILMMPMTAMRLIFVRRLG